MGGTITPFPGNANIRTPQPRAMPESVCQNRQVSADGRIVCRKVAKGDAEVSPALCATCPAARIGCDHLRFTLRKHEPVPIIVRYAGGRTEVWDDGEPAMCFTHAACTLCRQAIDGPTACAGCTLRTTLPAVAAIGQSQRAIASA
ncbi:MAG: hypothetical protein KKA73_17220 [Chloroflexi bacterium]|nr:hypothetical protein [Chloroflexota bacterium]MBU1749428.1 hypothetical protein [Chloroflexota bacterium]